MDWLPRWLDSPQDVGKLLTVPGGLYALLKTWRRLISWTNSDVQLQRCKEDNAALKEARKQDELDRIEAIRQREQARRERDILLDRVDDLLAALSASYRDGSAAGSPDPTPSRRHPRARTNGPPRRSRASNGRPNGSAAATSSKNY